MSTERKETTGEQFEIWRTVLKQQLRRLCVSKHAHTLTYGSLKSNSRKITTLPTAHTLPCSPMISLLLICH